MWIGTARGACLLVSFEDEGCKGSGERVTPKCPKCQVLRVLSVGDVSGVWPLSVVE